MRVNYCGVDLHRSEREVIVVNKKKKKKQEMSQRMPLSPECILHLNQLLYSRLKVFNSLP